MISQNTLLAAARVMAFAAARRVAVIAPELEAEPTLQGNAEPHGATGREPDRSR
jgi:hypothetical protein